MTATEGLIHDLKMWACSPRVPQPAQLVMLEAIGRLSAPTEALPLQCPWATHGSHMCRESFGAREEGRGTIKLRYPHGDERNKPDDDPYYFTVSPQREKP